MLFVVESEDDGSLSYSPILSADNSPNIPDITHDRHYYDSLVSHTSSVCGDNFNNPLVNLQEDHEFDNLENRPPGEIFINLLWAHCNFLFLVRIMLIGCRLTIFIIRICILV